MIASYSRQIFNYLLFQNGLALDQAAAARRGCAIGVSEFVQIEPFLSLVCKLDNACIRPAEISGTPAHALAMQA